MEARQDDVRRALVNAKMPVPTCAVLAALQQNHNADAEEVVEVLRHREPRERFIAANRVVCFLCQRGMAAIDWMPHTRGCKLCAGPAALPKTAGLGSVPPDQHSGEVKLAAASAMHHPDRTPSPEWTSRRHQDMAGPRCDDVPLPRWFKGLNLQSKELKNKCWRQRARYDRKTARAVPS